ncbi:MAG: adenylosuccinate lyase [Proteobacteria bacterium]|nr:adenylosuccinate lyase [Cystobacterineae bacterium]MCL2314518.1 adenylosuccinate lyase [Pseudomonadota bacterium]
MIPRYSRAEMVVLWTEEAKFGRWRDIELAALAAMVEEGLAPRVASDTCIEKAGTFGAEDVAAIEEIEKTTRHDVIAFLTFMERRIGIQARWLHFGMTSSDVLDTALALVLREAADVLLVGLERVMEKVKARAFELKGVRMMGRSHGIHAEPTTMGHKLALWYDELTRHRERLLHARKAIAVGMCSGAVGTFAHLPPAVEEGMCRRLGLVPANVSSQIIQRDIHAEYFLVLAQLATSIEKFAIEIRHLQRTEVGEVEEPFAKGQKGSSAMPHKRNPVLSENLTGLARLMRSYAWAALENVVLWHERDISHSSVERVIGPDATVTLDFMLYRFAGLVGEMRVYPEVMERNLNHLGGLVYSQRLLLALAEKGMERQAAYAMIQRNAMRFFEEGVVFRVSLLEDEELRMLMKPEEVEACFEEGYHTRHMDEIFARVFGEG